MKFEELPGIPRIWIDFLQGNLPFMPGPDKMTALGEHSRAVANGKIQRDALGRFLASAGNISSERTHENTQWLCQPDSVAVVANVHPSLFGGPFFQILKCLTAIKVCEALHQNKISAVPVCWINRASTAGFSEWSIQLIDDVSEIHCLRLDREPAKGTPRDALLIGNEISSLLSRISEIGHGDYDAEILEALRASYNPGATLAPASAQWVSFLMQEWGMVVLNPSVTDPAERIGAGQFSEGAASTWLRQSLTLPVLAHVVDPFEIGSLAETRQEYGRLGLTEPLMWPQTSATIVDSRSRRILEKRNLDPGRLFLGEDAILNEARMAMPGSMAEKLAGLKRESETRIADLNAKSSAESKFEKTARSAQKRIVYQLDRLKERFEAACAKREETARRQIHRVCNSLAPNRRLQERELAGIQMPLRYSRTGLQTIYKKLDIMDGKHQLIFMD